MSVYEIYHVLHENNGWDDGEANYNHAETVLKY